MTTFHRIDDLTPCSYDLIVADPPWLFKNRSEKGEAKNPNQHYRCMDLEAIASLPIGHLAQRDCILWLWTLNSMVPHALAVMTDWGFTFCTAGHWTKLSKNSRMDRLPIKQHFGPGYCVRGSGEPFLIGKIGAPKFGTSARCTIIAPVREHSRKPEETYSRALQLAPETVRPLDLFSREPRDGWDSCGDQADMFGEAAE